MGAAPSSMVPTGELAGQFRLTADQKTQHQVLSNIFQRLLRKNNLVDLAKTVNSEEQCKNLIVVLSSLLDKEFQTLRFQDVSNRSKLTTVSFTEAEAYLALQNRQERVEICKDIATFLVRFVVLVAGLTASVNMPSGIPSPLKSIEQIPFPDMDPLPSVKSVNMNVLEMLVNTGFAKKLTEDTYNLGNKYYLNTRGFLYHKGSMGQGNSMTKSPLLGIGFVFGAGIRSSASPYASTSTSTSGITGSTYDRTMGPALTQGFPISQAQLLEMRYKQQLEEQRRKNLTRLEERERELRAEAAEERRRLEFNVVKERARAEGLQENIQIAQARTQARAQPVTQSLLENGTAPPRPFMLMNGKASRRSRRSRRRITGGQYPPPGQFYSSLAPSTSNISLPPPSVPSSNPSLADYIIVQMYDAQKCRSSTLDKCALGEFYMDTQGHSWTKAYAESAFGSLRILESLPFGDRIESEGFQKVSSESVPVVLKRLSTLETGPVSPVETNRKREPFNVSANTIQKLQVIGKELVGDEVKNFGPAAERAHILAAPGPEKSILTMFCKDPWVGIKITNIPSFALLEALYTDVEGVDSQGTREKRDFLGKMEALGAWKRSGVATNTLSLFSDYVVGALPATLGDFCSAAGEGSQRIDNEEQKVILAGAYREMNAKYNRHLQDVVRFLATLFVIDTDFWSILSSPVGAGPEPTFRLHPSFLTHPTGSLEKLKERCKVARDMLANHYYEVETLYRKAIQGFADIRMSKKVNPADVLKDGARTGGRRKTRRVPRHRKS